MEQLKRRTSDDFSDDDDDIKRQKIHKTIDETNGLSRRIISHFEDLSNELIYDIFEYLDYFHVYEAFFNLNIRFQYLLIHSNLPLKINISSMSKSTFERYDRDIIRTNIDRIHSLCFADIFTYDHLFLSLHKLSEFDRLETLIVHNIGSVHLQNLLNQLSSLCLLSSLVITSVDHIKDKNSIYRQIFHIPALKYCKLSLEGWSDRESPLVDANEHSPIEHLIITNHIYFDQLDSLLSYIPQVRRLSLYLREGIWNKRPRISSLVLNHLTHLFLRLESTFDAFEQLAMDLFSHVQVLHVSISCSDQSYLNSDKWKQLILTYLPNLRVFDIELDIYANSNNDDQLRIENQINQFTSPFWMERQWSFVHHFYQKRYGRRIIFYSTNPYRRKHYTLYKQLDETTLSNDSQSSLNSVQQVHIQSEKSVLNCMYYFPNASELILEDGFSITRASVAFLFNRITPLHQLTKLGIECHHFSFKKVIELLLFTPQLHTLTFESLPFYTTDSTSIEESESFQFVSTTNRITKVVFKDKCTLDKLQMLVALCPRIQYLTITTLVRTLDAIIRFLLNKTNPNTRSLSLICFSRATNNWLERLDSLISSETLLENYSLQFICSKLYLCW